MNKRIIKKEFSETIRSRRFWVSAIVLYALLLVAMLGSRDYVKSETAIRNDASQATYRQWLNQGEKNPHSAAHYGFYAYKPVSPLAVVDKGLDDYLGNAVWLEAHNQNEVKSRNIADGLSLSRFGQLTPGLLLCFFVPLLMILLGYNSVSREIEGDTLRLLLSTGVGRSSILRSKAVALFLSTVLLVLPALMVLGSAAGATSFAAFGWLSFFLLLLYAFFAAVVTAVSAFSRQSSVSLVTLVAFWLVGIVLVPRLAGVAAKKLEPVPTAFAFHKAMEWDKEHGLDGHNPSNERGKKYEQEVLKKYGVDSVAQLPVHFAGLALQAGEEYGNQVYDKHFGGLYEGLQQQDRILALSTILSPFVAARNSTMGFAGTDLNRHALFVEQAEEYRRYIQKLLNEDFAKNAVGKDFATYLKGQELWGQVKNFDFKPYTATQLLRLQLPNILVLLAWLLFSFLLLNAAGKRLQLA